MSERIYKIFGREFSLFFINMKILLPLLIYYLCPIIFIAFFFDGVRLHPRPQKMG